MNGLKQRIIGALVLVSLAVIFVPMMFDEPHSERETSTIQIPEEPPFPEVEMPEPDTTESPSYRIEEPAPNVDRTAAGAEPEPATDSAPQESQNIARENPEPAPAPAQNDAAGTPGSGSEPITAEFARSLEGAWVVQLGSFGSSENAARLREQVREKGYSSHLQSITRGDSQLTRVFSGPFAEKAEAERAKEALDKAFGLNSLVTSGGK